MVIVFIFVVGVAALFFLIIFINRRPSGIKKEGRESSRGNGEADISSDRSSLSNEFLELKEQLLPTLFEDSEKLNIHLTQRLASVKYCERDACSSAGKSSLEGRTTEELDAELKKRFVTLKVSPSERGLLRRDSRDEAEELDRELNIRFILLKSYDLAVEPATNNGKIVKSAAVGEIASQRDSEKDNQHEVKSSFVGDQIPPVNNVVGDGFASDRDFERWIEYCETLDSEELEEYLQSQFPDSAEIAASATCESPIPEREQVRKDEDVMDFEEDLSLVESEKWETLWDTRELVDELKKAQEMWYLHTSEKLLKTPLDRKTVIRRRSIPRFPRAPWNRCTSTEAG